MSSATKKKAKKKTKIKPLVPKWKLFRANEPLLSVFMWGVNHTVRELSHVPPPMLLMPDDFKAYSKVKIDNQNFNKDHMPSHFKVKEYCPNVFRNLRERFGIEEQEYLRSLTWSEPKPDASPGRSGASFYRSGDEKFILKSMSPEEIAEIHSILRQYHEYVATNHGKTLLPQFLGMYRITVDGQETYLIVLRNILGRKYPVHKKYDLKGSTVQRVASDKERLKDLPTLKDNDFTEDGVKLFLPEDAQHKLREMLTRDTQFLSRLKLMDYSLLVGIHDCDRAAEDAIRKMELAGNQPPVPGTESSGNEGADYTDDDNEDQIVQPTPPDSPIPSTGAFAPCLNPTTVDLDHEFYAVNARPPKREIYFIGLVDILTYYGVKKRTATAAKSVKYGAEAEFSTVGPEQYAKRLCEFVSRQVLGIEPTEQPGVVISPSKINKGQASRTKSDSGSIGI